MNVTYENHVYFPARTLTNASAALLTQDCLVDQLVFCNTTASDATVTVTDGNTKSVANALVVPAHSTAQLNFAIGVFCKNGVKWLASANTTIDASVRLRTESGGAA